jgi:hypothetical protein
MSMHLNIFAHLVLSNAGNDIVVQAGDGLITVELQNLSAGRALFKTRPVSHERMRLVRDIQARLTGSNQCLEFRIADRMIAKLGVGARSSIASRLLGLRPLEIRPFEMLLAIIKSYYGLLAKKR